MSVSCVPHRAQAVLSKRSPCWRLVQRDNSLCVTFHKNNFSLGEISRDQIKVFQSWIMDSSYWLFSFSTAANTRNKWSRFRILTTRKHLWLMLDSASVARCHLPSEGEF